MSLPNRRTDETELVARVRAGEESAFTEIVRRHRPRLLAFARRLLAGRSECAEDVVQEALMRAHRALGRDEREMRLAPWLFALTRNCCLDELSRVHCEILVLDEPGEQPLLVDARSPEVVAEGRAGLREMLDGIATLPAEQRHALVRREVDGASYAQVADELGCSAQATRALVHRARRSLLAYRSAAATDVCATVQGDLLRAHRTGRRASHASHRHLVRCSTCRAYRARLKTLRRTLHAMHPGATIFLGAAAVKLASARGRLGAHAGRFGGHAGRLGGHSSLGAASAKATAAAVGLTAVLGAAAVGGTLVFRSGDRSPLAIRSPVLAHGGVRAGAPLPAGTAVVARTIRLRHGQAEVGLECPAGERVADLLAPSAPEVTAGYEAGVLPGVSTAARVTLMASNGQSASMAVAILCRRPQPDGALVPDVDAESTRTAQSATVCAQDYLLDRPGGRPIGSVGLAQPLEVLGRSGGWEKVQTEFHATGWVSRAATCGGVGGR
jgi:RNA polymerase sigma factor (sigma-70 family)